MHSITSPIAVPAGYAQEPQQAHVEAEGTRDPLSSCCGMIPRLNPLEGVPIQGLIRDSCELTNTLLQYIQRLYTVDCENLEPGSRQVDTPDSDLSHSAVFVRSFF